MCTTTCHNNPFQLGPGPHTWLNCPGARQKNDRVVRSVRVKRRENEIIMKSFVSLVSLSTFAVTIADRSEIFKGNRVRGGKKVQKERWQKVTMKNINADSETNTQMSCGLFDMQTGKHNYTDTLDKLSTISETETVLERESYNRTFRATYHIRDYHRSTWSIVWSKPQRSVP